MRRFIFILVFCLSVISLNAQSKVPNELFGTWEWENIADSKDAKGNIKISAEMSSINISRNEIMYIEDALILPEIELMAIFEIAANEIIIHRRTFKSQGAVKRDGFYRMKILEGANDNRIPYKLGKDEKGELTLEIFGKTFEKIRGAD